MPEERSYLKTHQISGRWFQLDISGELKKLREEMGDAHDKRGVALTKERGLRLVLTALRSGAKMDEHQAPGPALVHVLEGRVRVGLDGEEVELGVGDAVVFDSEVRHGVEAMEDSAILITIADQHAV